jgi:hypothetical protein
MEYIWLALIINTYLLSVFSLRWLYRVMYRLGEYNADGSKGHLVWFIPVINTIGVLTLGFIAINKTLSEGSFKNKYLKSFFNHDLKDKETND